MNGLCQQVTRIERLVLFQHGPGNHQHLGSNLDTGFGLDATFPLTSFQHAVVDATESIVVVGGDQCGLIQTVAQFGIASFGNHWHLFLASLAAAAGVEIQPGQTNYLLTTFMGFARAERTRGAM